MYFVLLKIHSLWRWAVLGSLLYSILYAVRGRNSGGTLSPYGNMIRHWTATIAHVQLMLGILVYTQSPVIRYFWKAPAAGLQSRDTTFFALIHLVLMLGSIVLITIGSALAKRRRESAAAYRTIIIYYAIALLLILLAIPWPDSPFAQRPLLR